VPWPGRRRQQNERAQQDPARGQPLRGPERAYFQRLAGDYPHVSSTGKLTLTGTHLVFDSRIGADVVVSLQDVTRAMEQKIRRFHIGGHGSQLVVATRSGEIGFLLAGPADWADAINGQLC
jgi:hypothetical protein